MQIQRIAAFLLCTTLRFAQSSSQQHINLVLTPLPINSHEVNSDGTVTFRYRNPTAQKVELSISGTKGRIPFIKDPTDKSGLWTLTKPLSPELYAYSFVVDGRTQLDPLNQVTVPNLLSTSSLVEVPGPTPMLWDAQDVPHGELHHHFYKSSVVLGLKNGQSDYFVYTPPGYDLHAKARYPVLYLLHGYSDAADAWPTIGRVNFILDNLIAQGKAKPMIVVMPLGYGDMSFVINHPEDWSFNSLVGHNTELLTQALLTEILPQVESEYHVAHDRDHRAITGLSMGGYEALAIGLTHSNLFAWVGGFSSAVENLHPEKMSLTDASKANLHLLWIACGVDDSLVASNRNFIAQLKQLNYPLTAVETPGMHTWMVWHDNLIHFAPLIFQK